MNEKKDPVLSARVDVLLIALLTHLKLNPDPRFKELFLASKAEWKDLLIASEIPESYLEELDLYAQTLVEDLGPGDEQSPAPSTRG